MTLYSIDLPYANFGIIVDAAGVVTEAAPIAAWMIGKSIADVSRWIVGKSGTIEPVVDWAARKARARAYIAGPWAAEREKAAREKREMRDVAYEYSENNNG